MSKARWLLVVTLIACTGLLPGCFSVPLLVEPGKIESSNGSRSDLRAALRTLPPMGKAGEQVAQLRFERELQRTLIATGTFSEVYYRPSGASDLDPEDIDLILEVERMELKMTRMVNPLGFILSIATLGIYLIVGLPISTEIESYEVDLVASTPEGAPLFRMSFDEWWSDSYGMWSSKVRKQAETGRFYATETRHAMERFVRDLQAELAKVELPASVAHASPARSGPSSLGHTGAMASR